jgi:acylphosphatase
MKKEAHLIITGAVQGVFFRVKSQKKACSLNITGWVKNIDNDKVEILAQGEEKSLKELIQWCQEEAPGKVEGVSQEWLKISKKFANFEILY